MEISFIIIDPDGHYTPRQIMRILEIAEEKGYSLKAGSVVEKMTVRQLARLICDEYDA